MTKSKRAPKVPHVKRIDFAPNPPGHIPAPPPEPTDHMQHYQTLLKFSAQADKIEYAISKALTFFHLLPDDLFCGSGAFLGGSLPDYTLLAEALRDELLQAEQLILHANSDLVGALNVAFEQIHDCN